MIEYPLEIWPNRPNLGPNGPGLGSWLTSIWSPRKGPSGQPVGTNWLTYEQIDSQIARQVQAKIQAACKTAPIADITTASKAELVALNAYSDVLNDPNAVTQVVTQVVQDLTVAGKLVPLIGCGAVTPATPAAAATAATAALASPSNMILLGGAGLAFLLLMRRR